MEQNKQFDKQYEQYIARFVFAKRRKDNWRNGFSNCDFYIAGSQFFRRFCNLAK